MLVQLFEIEEFKWAFDIAKKAHEGQKRWSGEDYFTTHVVQVALDLYEHTIYSSNPKYLRATIVAILHDVVEDTSVTLSDLKEVFRGDIVDGVRAITHFKDEEYDNYIARLCNNELARIVKPYDIRHNLSSMGDDRKNVNKKRLYKLALKYIELYEECCRAQ